MKIRCLNFVFAFAFRSYKHILRSYDEEYENSVSAKVSKRSLFTFQDTGYDSVNVPQDTKRRKEETVQR